MIKRPTLTLSGSEKKIIDSTEGTENIETSEQTEIMSKAKIKTDAEHKLQDKTDDKAASNEIQDNGKSVVGKTKSLTNTSNTAGSAVAFSSKTNKHFISNEDYKTILKYLRKNYPKCFPVNYNDLVPLAIGIHKELFDIPDLPFAEIKVRKFFARYVRQKAYRAKLIVGSNRIGLDGSFTSKVLETEINRDEWKKTKDKRPKVDKVTHDRLIKKALENPAIAQEFLEMYLPEEYKDLIDLTTVNPEKESFIEDSLKSKFSDMVFSVQLRADKINDDTQRQNQKSQGQEINEVNKVGKISKEDETAEQNNKPDYKDIKNQDHEEREENKTAFIYCMIEHQSSSDYWIALRLLKYSLLLLERHATGRNKLPVILPLVLYNGKKGYSAPRNMFELFTHPKLARKVMTEDYKLVDLQAMSDDDINYDKHLSFLMYVMKHIHDRDMLAMLKDAMERCNKAIIIDQEQNYILTRLILWYTDSKIELKHKQALEQLVKENLLKQDTANTGDIMKTIAQSYVDEGYDKGIQEGEARGIEKGELKGIEKAALNMLSQNLAPELIAQYTGLTVEQINKLRH